jgi:polyisoprenoid-binding protein YceI
VRRGFGIVAAVVLAALSWPDCARSDALTLRLLPNQSRATFKSDAPLETFVGNTTSDGIDGVLTVDPTNPGAAMATIKVDMNLVRTGIERRDTQMRSKEFLDTETELNRWVTFEVKAVDIAGSLEPGKTIAAKVRGILTVKQKPVERVAEATVTYIKLTPEELESQRRFGFTSDNVKVRAKLTTTFTDHRMQVPRILFLKVSNELQLETDLTFVRAQ